MKRIRLLLPCPKPRKGNFWGDWFFANSLSKAFIRLGYSVKYEYRAKHKDSSRNNWSTRYLSNNEVDLVIRGSFSYRPIRRRPFFIWLISQVGIITDTELAEAQHIFVASAPFAEKLRSQGLPVTYLPQCTDPNLFRSDAIDRTRASGVLFVGNRRSYATRPVVDLARRSGADLSVWGSGWEGQLPSDIWKGRFIHNDDLATYYASAKVVLNDHTPDMLENGFVSNRVYDVLACGRPLLTEEMAGFPDDLQEHVYMYTEKNFSDQLSRALTEAGANRHEVAAYVREKHSFAQRAKEISDIIQGDL